MTEDFFFNEGLNKLYHIYVIDCFYMHFEIKIFLKNDWTILIILKLSSELLN